HIVVAGGLKNHFGRRFATRATALGQVRAKVSRVDEIFADLPQNFSLDRAVLLLREITAPDSALIRDDNDFITTRFQFPQRRRRSFKNVYFFYIATVINVAHQRA